MQMHVHRCEQHAYMHTRRHSRVHSCTHVDTHAQMHTHKHACTHAYIPAWGHDSEFVSPNADICKGTNTAHTQRTHMFTQRCMHIVMLAATVQLCAATQVRSSIRTCVHRHAYVRACMLCLCAYGSQNETLEDIHKPFPELL